ncbi:MAG: TRAP transporter TatT component family protein [bacterium]
MSNAARSLVLVSCAVIALSSTGCTNLAANLLAGGEGPSVYATDDDPELVRDAVPFGLKLQEQVLQKTPEHQGLLTSLAKSYTQYAYGLVYPDSEAPGVTVAQAKEIRARVKKLLLRARGYGFRALDVSHPGFEEGVRKDRAATLAKITKDELAMLYWTGAAWGAAAAVAKDDPLLLGDLGVVEAMMKRAQDLDACYDKGAIHEVLMSLDASRPESMGGSVERAAQHREQIAACGGADKIGPTVSWAASVSVRKQDKAEFEKLLKEALAFDVNKAPDFKLANILAQRRAQRLLDKADDLFLSDDE